MIEQKVGAAVLAAALTTIVVGILAQYGIVVPFEVAGGVTTVLTFVAGYLAPHTPRPAVTP